MYADCKRNGYYINPTVRGNQTGHLQQLDETCTGIS